MDESNELLTEKRGRIGVLTFNRPERRNALSPRLLIALHETLEAWAQEDEIRSVVITGSGEKAFSSGYDILAIPTDVTPETAGLPTPSCQETRDARGIEQPYLAGR